MSGSEYTKKIPNIDYSINDSINVTKIFGDNNFEQFMENMQQSNNEEGTNDQAIKLQDEQEVAQIKQPESIAQEMKNAIKYYRIKWLKLLEELGIDFDSDVDFIRPKMKPIEFISPEVKKYLEKMNRESGR